MDILIFFLSFVAVLFLAWPFIFDSSEIEVVENNASSDELFELEQEVLSGNLDRSTFSALEAEIKSRND